jgi:PAS domain S-box-containing protein
MGSELERLVSDRGYLEERRRRAVHDVSTLAHYHVLVHDFEGRILQASPSLTALLGYEPGELPGLHIRELTENFQQVYFDEILSYLIVRGYANCDTRFRKKNGEWVEVFIDVYHLEAGADSFIFNYIRPKSSRPASLHESKIQQMESLGRLAGGIAHDFNNLLGIIQGRASLLSSTPPGGQEPHLRAIHEGVARAKQLTKQLLTFSKGGSPSRQLADVGTLVRETVEFCLSGSGVEPFFDIPNDLRNCRVDRDQISQVLQNLVLNSRDAMGDAGRLIVTCTNMPDFQIPNRELPKIDYIKIQIRDTGPGIPEEIIAHIFEPYFTTKPGGHGLGLAVAFSILDRHAGHIHCCNNQEGGACFIVYLPAEPRGARVPVVPVKPAPAAGPLRILLLEDNAPLAQVTRMLCEQFGHRVEWASRGEDALALFDQSLKSSDPFTLLLFDLVIPGAMGGLQTIRAIRRLAPNIPALAYSGYSDEPAVGSGLFDALLAKPFTAQQLTDAISQAVRLRACTA